MKISGAQDYPTAHCQEQKFEGVGRTPHQHVRMYSTSAPRQCLLIHKPANLVERPDTTTSVLIHKPRQRSAAALQNSAAALHTDQKLASLLIRKPANRAERSDTNLPHVNEVLMSL